MGKRTAISCKPVGNVAGIPLEMMVMIRPMGRQSLVIVVCCGLMACDGTKRDFDGASGSDGETSQTIGATGTESASSSASMPDVSTVGAATEGTPSSPVDTADSETLDVSEPVGTAPSSSTPSGSVTDDTAAPSSSSTAESDTSGAQMTDSSAGESSTGAEPTPTACDASLLRNGDFEVGTAGWSATSSYSAFEQRVHPLVVENGHASLEPYPVTAHDGTQFAFLGDVPDDEYEGYHTTLSQSVTIPADSAGLWLSGYVWVDTSEPADMEYDYAYIQLEPLDDQDKYQQFTFWTNLDASNGWVKIDEYMDDVSALHGREVNVVIRADTDANVATRFWYDSLQLVSSCPE